jgi:hypothetical protein
MTESNDSVGFVLSAVKVRVSIAQCQSASQVHEPYFIIGGSPVMRPSANNLIYSAECEFISTIIEVGKCVTLHL